MRRKCAIRGLTTPIITCRAALIQVTTDRGRDAALRQAYSIRSSYLHHLKDIPRLLVGIEGFHETMVVDGQPTLTFAGLARHPTPAPVHLLPIPRERRYPIPVRVCPRAFGAPLGMRP